MPNKRHEVILILKGRFNFEKILQVRKSQRSPFKNR